MNASKKAISAIRKKGGIITYSEAMKCHIHPEIMIKLLKNNTLEKISRGVYRLKNLEPMVNPDFAIIAKIIPGAVICMDSALSYYEMTNVIPSKVHIAIKKGSRKPKLEFPNIKVYHFSEKQYLTGITTKKIDGVNVKIYSPEKTIVDILRFRNRVSMEVVKMALKEYLATKKRNIKMLIEYSKISRIATVTKSYITMML